MEFLLLKYLLVPLIVGISMIGFSLYAKANALLRPKKLILFLLITAILLAFPALLGLMKYHFVPFGLITTEVYFTGFGLGMLWFMKTELFESVGFDGKRYVILAFLLVTMLIGAWLFFLAFEYLSGMRYSIWVPLTVVWVLFPIFFFWAMDTFASVPPPIYNVLDPLDRRASDDSIWENEDYLRMMTINLNIKRETEDEKYTSYPARAPSNITVAQWFLRYLRDQRIKFPNSVIESESEGEPYCWIFYTTRFFIFNRPIAHEKTFRENRISKRADIFVRRVSRPEKHNHSRS